VPLYDGGATSLVFGKPWYPDSTAVDIRGVIVMCWRLEKMITMVLMFQGDEGHEFQLCRGQLLILILPARDVHSTTTSHAKTF
jgi:hypothetical protein